MKKENTKLRKGNRILVKKIEPNPKQNKGQLACDC